MRHPTRTIEGRPRRHAAARPRARGARLGIALMLALFAPPAHASHYLVDAGGGGDFTTIQAAVSAASPRDSILVAAGSYPEVVDFTAGTSAYVLHGLGGADSTTLHGLLLPEFAYHGTWALSGLTFDRFLDLDQGNSDDAVFSDCDFAQGANFFSRGDPPNLTRCDFHGRTSLINYTNAGPPGFLQLHFTAAPLLVESGEGDTWMTQCTFEGPADTLVTVHEASGSNPVDFEDCRFEGARTGIVFRQSCDNWTPVDRCTFEDIAGVAIELGDSSQTCGSRIMPLELAMQHSRFERCGTAVHWLGVTPQNVGMTADTILASAQDALVLGPGLANRLDSLVVDGGQASGLVVSMLHGDWPPGVILTHSRVGDFAGDGIRVVDSAPNGELLSRIEECRVDHNLGTGIRVSSAGFWLAGNLVYANGGDGIHFSILTSGYFPDSVVSNTCVQNGGDGIRVEHPVPLAGVDQVVQRNLAALNGAYGVELAPPHPGSAAYNDGWKNYLADYTGLASPGDSNLVADPLFCDLSSADFTLQAGSPCAPGGVYGQIGALPVGCASLAGAPPAAAPQAFAVHPNPARGAVWFDVPPGAAASLDVLDLGGRRVWSQAVPAAGGTLRWSGDGAAGPLRPGLYWARLTRAGETRLVRVVWLR